MNTGIFDRKSAAQTSDDRRMTVCPKSSAAADSGYWFGTPLFSPDGFASRWEIGDASGGVLASDRVGEPKHYRAQAGKPLRKYLVNSHDQVRMSVYRSVMCTS